MGGWSSRDDSKLNPTCLPSALDLDDQDIRDAVAVGTASETNRDVVTSVAVTTEFDPTRGAKYHMLTANKKRVARSAMHGSSR